MSDTDVEVIIDTNDGDSDVVRMDQDDSDIRLLKNPVRISNQIDDLFQVVEISQCEINLLSKHYLGGQLFGNNARDVRVNVWRSGKCLFAGFLEPQVFNQPYNKSWDQISVTAYDGLGSLQYSMYDDIMTQADYSERKQQIDSILIQTILEKQMKNILNLDIKNSRKSNVFYDGSVRVASDSDVKSIFSKVQLYESLFFGEVFDDLMDAQTVIEEILKYFNLHIRQEGLDYYIYHRASIGKNLTWSAIIGTGEQGSQEQSEEVSYDYYKRVENSFMMFNGEPHERLINQKNGQSLPGKKLAWIPGNSIEYIDGEYRRYYNIICPDLSTIKSDKYDVVDVSDNLNYIRKSSQFKVLIQNANGDYEFVRLDNPPATAYSGGSFAKSYYEASANEFIISEV